MSWPPDNCRVPTGRRYKYPALNAADRQALDTLMTRHPPPVQEWWFNVPVGPRPTWADNDDFSDTWHQIDAHHRARADLVARIANHLQLVEVKPLADMKAVGQAVTYLRYALAYCDAPPETTAAVWCFRSPNEITDVLQRLGIGLRTADHSQDLPPSPLLLDVFTQGRRSMVWELPALGVRQDQTPQPLSPFSPPG